MTETHAEETGDTVASHSERTYSEHNTLTRSCLSGDGDILVGTCQTALQLDYTTDIEDNGARTADFLYAIAERALNRILVVAVVLKCGYMIDRTVTSAYSPFTPAFGTGESKVARTERPESTGVGLSVNLLIDTPVVSQLMA